MVQLNLSFKKKSGQLFIIESFIAVSVMIIMVAAIYKVQLATEPPKEQHYDEIAYQILKSLDNSGTLDEYVVTLKSGTSNEKDTMNNLVSSTIYASLPDNGEFKFYCTNLTSNTIISDSQINTNLNPTSDSLAVEYLILEINGNYEPYSFYLLVWLKGV